MKLPHWLVVVDVVVVATVVVVVVDPCCSPVSQRHSVFQVPEPLLLSCSNVFSCVCFSDPAVSVLKATRLLIDRPNIRRNTA